MASPLSAFPLATTDDTDEAQSIIGHKLARVRSIKINEPKSFLFEMNGVAIGDTLVAYNQMGTDTKLDLGVLEDGFYLLLGVGNPPKTTLDGMEVVCKNHAAIAGVGRRVVHQRVTDGGMLIVRTATSAVERLLWDALDQRPKNPVVFDRSIDLATGVGSQTNVIVRNLVGMIQSDPTLLDNPLIRSNFDELLKSVLISLPHNYRDEVFSRAKPETLPRIVHLAESYIEAYAGEAITISDIVSACGTSRAVLFSTFRKFRAYTPMEFLIKCRLNAARKAFETPAVTDTVSSIALRCGFAHLGRFSHVYKLRFGESPSDTLRRSRVGFCS
jgi:AraC-like DNA-binding protein